MKSTAETTYVVRFTPQEYRLVLLALSLRLNRPEEIGEARALNVAMTESRLKQAEDHLRTAKRSHQHATADIIPGLPVIVDAAALEAAVAKAKAGAS